MEELGERSCVSRLPHTGSWYAAVAANAWLIPCVCYSSEDLVYLRYDSTGPAGPSLCYDIDIASCNCCGLSQKSVDFSGRELICLKHLRKGGSMNLQELL